MQNKILYLNGFDSGANDKYSLHIRSRLPGIDMDAPEVTSYDFFGNHRRIKELIDKNHYDIIVGFSMGGFYASQFYAKKRVLINPAFNMFDVIEYYMKHGWIFDENELQYFYRDPVVYEDSETIGIVGDGDKFVNSLENYKKYFGETYKVFKSGHSLPTKVIDKLIIPELL